MSERTIFLSNRSAAIAAALLAIDAAPLERPHRTIPHKPGKKERYREAMRKMRATDRTKKQYLLKGVRP